MNQLSHEQARKLIQFKIDRTLDSGMASLLGAHLRTCTECRSYANELGELGSILQRAMESKWDQRPAPLNIEQITRPGRNKAFGFAGNLMATRKAVMVLMIFTVAMSAWQFAIHAIPTSTPSVVIPIPTPSAELTSTTAITQECDYFTYQVHENDTWASIAAEFSIPRKMLMDFNRMNEDTIVPLMEIKIPFCEGTPTLTVNTPTDTITITPQFESITLTPG